jgi:hypothetical protein
MLAAGALLAAGEGVTTALLPPCHAFVTLVDEAMLHDHSYYYIIYTTTTATWILG